MSESANVQAVRRLLFALRERDETATAAALHDEVRAVGQRGPKHGVDEVVAWAKPSRDGALVSSVEVDELREVGEAGVAVAARRQWRWSEGDELADEQPFGILFRIRDERVVDWDQTYLSIDDAIEAAASA